MILADIRYFPTHFVDVYKYFFHPLADADMLLEMYTFNEQNKKTSFSMVHVTYTWLKHHLTGLSYRQKCHFGLMPINHFKALWCTNIIAHQCAFFEAGVSVYSISHFPLTKHRVPFYCICKYYVSFPVDHWCIQTKCLLLLSKTHLKEKQLRYIFNVFISPLPFVPQNKYAI